jgi:chromosome segregation ATPase
MDEKLIDKLRQEVKDTEEALRGAEAAKAEADQKVTDVQAEVNTANETISSLNEEVEGFKTKLAELEVALQAAAEAKETIEKELTESKEKLDVFEAKEAEAAATALLEARLQELPEVVRKNLDEHPEKEALLSAWRTADDEAWDTISQAFKLSDRPDYVSRSDKEGRLATGSGGDKADSGLQKHIR